MNKPTSIVREEFKNNLVNLINDSGLQMFIIEPILQSVLAEVRAVANAQLEMDKKRYEESLTSMMAGDFKVDEDIEESVVETEDV